MKKYLRPALMIAFIAAFLAAVYFFIGRPMIRLVGDPQALSEYIDNYGIKGFIIFAGLVTVQTMSTCIPGTPFYLASGYVMGGVKAALLCDLAATIGNTIAFLLGRKFGDRLLKFMFSEEKIASINAYIKKGNPKLIHIMFMLLPLPKDTYAWFGYYSEENLITFMIITFIARFPHIFLYTFGGSMLVEKQYGVLIIGATFAVLLYAGLTIYLKKKKSASSKETD